MPQISDWNAQALNLGPVRRETKTDIKTCYLHRILHFITFQIMTRNKMK